MSRTKSNFWTPNKIPDNTSSNSWNWYKEYSCIIEKPTYEWRPKVTQERLDGSSDGLFEALDMSSEAPNPDEEWIGYNACSNWENGLHQKWTLKEIFPPLDELDEPTAEELVKEFYKNQQYRDSK